MNDFDFKVCGVSRYPKEPSITTLDDVSIAADPKSLRALAAFLMECAERIEGLRDEQRKGWHMHFQDWLDSWEGYMHDVIVAIPE